MAKRGNGRREAFLLEYNQSGRVEEAARRVGVGKSTGYAWIRELREAGAATAKPLSFVELVPSARRSEASQPILLHVGSATIEVPRGFDAVHLQQIVAALGREQS